jgi:hypothetical protein
VLTLIDNPTAEIPAPMIAPVSAWVVEIGKPVTVASMTVPAAPAATPAMKGMLFAISRGTTPLPENTLIKSAARKT